MLKSYDPQNNKRLINFCFNRYLSRYCFCNFNDDLNFKNMTIAPEQIAAYIQGLEARISEYKKWDEARAMVINYLKNHHGLEDHYQWAFKIIELLEQLKEKQTKGAGDDYPIIDLKK